MTADPQTTRAPSLTGLRLVLAAATLTPLLRWATVIHSVPAGQPWRRTCPHCAAALELAGPAARALLPRARCGLCRGRVGPPPFTVEAAAVAVATILALSNLSAWELAAYGWWAACAVVLTFVDAAVHRLPDRLTFPAAAGFLALAAPAALTMGQNVWLRALLAALALAALLSAVAFVRPTALGFGDAKAGLAVGAAAGWLGWSGLLAALFLASAAAALYGIGLLLAGRASWSTHIPMGPFLFAGALLAVVAFG